MSRTARAFASTVFPVTLGGCLWLALALMRDGTEPFVALGLASLPGYLIVGMGEWVFPLRHTWLRSHGDVLTDMAFGLSDAAIVEVLRPLVYVGAVALAGAAAGQVGLGLWPTHWSVLMQLALALVVAELPKYWLHRLEHEREWLWRIHATHHSVPRLYWLNASRFHPIDIGLDTLAGLVPLALLGATPPVIALFFLVSAVHGIFQHANLQLRLGPLNWVFSMAELHRWHHSRVVEDANTNYGQNLIVWDVVFGTRYLPADRDAPGDIGLADLPDFPRTFLGMLASPFRWPAARPATSRRDAA